MLSAGEYLAVPNNRLEDVPVPCVITRCSGAHKVNEVICDIAASVHSAVRETNLRSAGVGATLSVAPREKGSPPAIDVPAGVLKQSNSERLLRFQTDES
jgi:hypothetical protein